MYNKYIYDFEKPLNDIQNKINDLKTTSLKTGVDITLKINDLEKQLNEESIKIYSSLTRWQKVQLARHPDRPHSKDYIDQMTSYWLELHGDRKYADDKAIISGIAKIDDYKVAIIAQEKGRGTKDKVYRNFGMPQPEGYRKAMRIMRLAEKHGIPIITLIDTPGAYPGIGAEERGQAEAIANNLFEMSRLEVPIISIVIGEGASGGALAIGLSDKILCMENTWYSVISPEGCASILYRDSSMSEKAADSMKVTSIDLNEMGIADEIIKEPLGGAHRDLVKSATNLKNSIISNLNKLSDYSISELINNRQFKYDKIGSWTIDE
tara:strand:+ start:1090 stop:2055 length:966 start_codon:yes stop_codon:yes gene_type:complete